MSYLLKIGNAKIDTAFKNILKIYWWLHLRTISLIIIRDQPQPNYGYFQLLKP